MALISTFPALPLTYQCAVRWEAWATDWSGQVSGVVITDPVLYGLNLTPPDETTTAAEQVQPLWLPLPTETADEPAEPAASGDEDTSG